MRGRVDVAIRKRFVICPPYSAMTDDEKRIQALNSAELGGFNIAMKDLEIRGAGDLLGERAKWFHQ
jgi:transcription-repair coupling factor (superfamily II helicase)